MSNAAYLEYLGSLNFQPNDVVCIGIGTKKKKGDWKNFFKLFSDLSAPSAFDSLKTHNDNGKNIYISMAPFLVGTTERTKENVSAVRHVFIETDEHAESTRQKIVSDLSAGLIPEPAVMVESSPGRFQVIWHVSSADFALNGNGTADIAKHEKLLDAICQHYDSDDASTDTARFLRVAGFTNHNHNEKAVAKVLAVGGKLPARFDDFKIESVSSIGDTTVVVSGSGPMIPYGQHDKELHRIAGRLRHDGLEEEAIYNALVEICEKRCENYGSDYLDMCRKHAHNICKHPVGTDDTVLVGGRPAGSPAEKAPLKAVIDDSQIDRSTVAEKPSFPRWVFHGTSLYSGLVVPAIRTSTKLPELIWLPAVATMLNSLSTKVRIKGLNNCPLTIYLGEIACKGTFKSSCVELGLNYFRTMGLLDDYKTGQKNADGKQLVFTAGSTEGLGINMAQTGCRTGILYYDELRKAARKMNIEGSSFSSDLLSIYESGKFTNSIKNSKQSYTFEAGGYCISWIWCTTFKNFHEVWPKIMGSNTDLTDRMFFLLGPERLSNNDKAGLWTDPNVDEGVVKTYQLISQAIQQGIYDYEDYNQAQIMIREGLAGLSVTDEDGDDSTDLSYSRMIGLVQRLALYFAVDLGLTCIDEECLARAIALVKYRCQVIRYLRPIEAESKLGQLQQQMIHVLRTHKGQMTVRLWKQLLNYNRHDTELWWRAQNGLERNKRIKCHEDVKPMSGGRVTNLISLLKQPD